MRPGPTAFHRFNGLWSILRVPIGNEMTWLLRRTLPGIAIIHHDGCQDCSQSRCIPGWERHLPFYLVASFTARMEATICCAGLLRPAPVATLQHGGQRQRFPRGVKRRFLVPRRRCGIAAITFPRPILSTRLPSPLPIGVTKQSNPDRYSGVASQGRNGAGHEKAPQWTGAQGGGSSYSLELSVTLP